MYLQLAKLFKEKQYTFIGTATMRDRFEFKHVGKEYDACNRETMHATGCPTILDQSAGMLMKIINQLLNSI